MTYDKHSMFPRVSPLAGIKPKINRTVHPEQKPATLHQWARQLFRGEHPKPVSKSPNHSFEL